MEMMELNLLQLLTALVFDKAEVSALFVSMMQFKASNV